MLNIVVLPSIYKYKTKVAIDKCLYCYAFIRILSRYRKCNIYGLLIQGARGVNHASQRKEGDLKLCQHDEKYLKFKKMSFRVFLKTYFTDQSFELINMLIPDDTKCFSLKFVINARITSE